VREKHNRRISLAKKIASMAASDDTSDIPVVDYISLVNETFNVQPVVFCRCSISQKFPIKMAQHVRPSLCTIRVVGPLSYGTVVSKHIPAFEIPGVAPISCRS
jgi:hypothetical protein